MAPFCGPNTAAASAKRVVTSQATTSSIPRSAPGEPTAPYAPRPPSVVDEPPQPITIRRAPASRAARRSWPTPAVVARKGSSWRGLGRRARPAARGHLDDRRQGLVAVAPDQHPPLGLDPGSQWPRHDGCVPCPTQHEEQALAAVGHRHLVRGPPGGPGRVRRWRPPPRRLRPSPGICPGRRRRGARGGSYRVVSRETDSAGERIRTSTPFRGPGPKPGASANSATPAAGPPCGLNRECTAVCLRVPPPPTSLVAMANASETPHRHGCGGRSGVLRTGLPATPQGAHRLHRQRDRPGDGQPGLRPARPAGGRGPRQGHLSLHQLAGWLGHRRPGHLRHHAVRPAGRLDHLRRAGGQHGPVPALRRRPGQALRPAPLADPDAPALRVHAGPGGGHRHPGGADHLPEADDGRADRLPHRAAARADRGATRTATGGSPPTRPASTASSTRSSTARRPRHGEAGKK